MRRKPRISAKSVPIIRELDEYVRRYDIRGPYERFQDVASDVLDGGVLRNELADLVNRRLLTVVRYGFDDSRGSDLARWLDPRQCGTDWSVNPTRRLVSAVWPDRLTASE